MVAYLFTYSNLNEEEHFLDHKLGSELSFNEHIHYL